MDKDVFYFDDIFQNLLWRFGMVRRQGDLEKQISKTLSNPICGLCSD
jgi:hypothetical protein